MKLYVWTNVLHDYTAGMAAAIAPDLESALASFGESYVREDLAKAEPEVIEINRKTKPQGWYVYGGG
jgi:hypothetical protein